MGCFVSLVAVVTTESQRGLQHCRLNDALVVTLISIGTVMKIVTWELNRKGHAISNKFCANGEQFYTWPVLSSTVLTLSKV